LYKSKAFHVKSHIKQEPENELFAQTNDCRPDDAPVSEDWATKSDFPVNPEHPQRRQPRFGSPNRGWSSNATRIPARLQQFRQVWRYVSNQAKHFEKAANSAC